MDNCHPSSEGFSVFLTCMKNTLQFSLVTVFLLVCASLRANEPSSSIYVKLQKLHSLKRVLYVAAHPDDENTRALAWFSLGEKAETAYFSLTRGDGGQNLIGNELGAPLGVLRTQELLAARSYDGANQYFSRALDFGYSKSATESLEKWGEDALLSDLVLMIRKFRPDVIVTRFPPDKRGGHGHHTASAMLAIKAFDLAADASYKNKGYDTWQTTSLYWNTSTWWVKDLADSVKNDPKYFSVDIGGYNDHLGMSYNEIGTLARSQHKCQGFGAIIERGSRVEYFEHLKGKYLKESFFENNQKSWSEVVDRVFDKAFDQVLTAFDFQNPSRNVPALLEILKGLAKIENKELREEKTQRCKEIILDCLGLRIELNANDYAFQPGNESDWVLNALNRSEMNVQLVGINLGGEFVSIEENLEQHQPFKKELKKSLNVNFTNPYWLDEPHGDLFVLKNDQNLLRPENKPTVEGTVRITIAGTPLDVLVEGIHKWRDPSYGERTRPIIAMPKAAFVEGAEILIAKIDQKKKIVRKVHCFDEKANITIEVQLPVGWKASENRFELSFDRVHQEKVFEFEVWPTEGAQNGDITFKCDELESGYISCWQEITYDHIPTQSLLQKAKVSCKALDVKIESGKIAFINGVEDGVPLAMERLGFQVDRYDVEDLNEVDLSGYRSVVLGIRVYNVHPELRNFEGKLFEYVENGGNVIMQYNTASRSLRELTFGPKPFSLSRNRVTEEDAEVTFELPKHQVLNYPNRLSKEDFENWVQERGLYFAADWDKSYEAPLSWHDIGEDPQLGSLIIAKHGKGQFVYTGISFFRELPKGVVGAYRLFANILSYTHE